MLPRYSTADSRGKQEMERVSIKQAFLLCLFMAASLLPSSLMAQISVGPNKKQLFMTGQLCKSHDDCKANSVYSGNFCVNKISGSEMGHCVGFGSMLENEDQKCKHKKNKHKKSKPKPGTCGKCETDEDCRSCPVVVVCEKLVADGLCM